jgi:hypothetical protein
MVIFFPRDPRMKAIGFVASIILALAAMSGSAAVQSSAGVDPVELLSVAAE